MTSSNKDGSDLRAGSKTDDKTLSGDEASSASAEGKGEMSAEEALITQVAQKAKAEADAEAAGVADHVTTGAADGVEAREKDLSEKLSRALAEVENSRRRFERERADALRYGASRLAADMFEVADNLRRACGFVSAEAKERDENLRNLVIGIEMTEKMLGDAFSRNGIDVIAPNIGDAFNAEEHQAVSEIENSDVGEGCVVEVVLRGYRMGERLLRPTQVITAKRKETEAEAEKTPENSEKTDEEEKT